MRGPRLRAGWRLWIGAAIAALLVLGGAVGLSRLSAESTGSGGTLTAERTSHDFGRAGMSAGLLKTSFSLALQGEPLVTSLFTN